MCENVTNRTLVTIVTLGHYLLDYIRYYGQRDNFSSYYKSYGSYSLYQMYKKFLQMSILTCLYYRTKVISVSSRYCAKEGL